jgi:hypothetical protein
MERPSSSSLRIWSLVIISYFAVALLILVGCTKPVSPPTHSWPDAKWRPYADSSPFNFVIPPNAPDLTINPGSNSSSVIVNQIIGSLAHCDPNVSATYSNCKPTNWVASQDHMSGGGWPTYQPIATDPLINIVCNGGPCPFSGHNVQVRMPAGAHVQVGSPDRHLTIIDRDGVAQRDGHAAPKNIEYDFYQVQEDSIPPMDGGTIHVTAEGSLRLDGNGVTDVGGDLGGNTTASDFGNLAGRVRVEELNAGHINHALTITVSCNNGSVAYPARATGGSSSTCPTTGAGPVPGPAMGQLIQLKMSPDAINATSSNPWVRTVLTAMANLWNVCERQRRSQPKLILCHAI